MKTIKVMKKLALIPVLLFSFIFLPSMNIAQEAEKEVKIKVVKEKNGERTVMDTTIVVSGEGEVHDLDELKKLLKEEGIEDFDFDFDFDADQDGEVKVKVVEIETGDGEEDKIMVIKHQGDEDSDVEIEKDYMITVMKSGDSEEGGVIKMSVDAGGEGVFVSEDGNIHKIEVGEGEGNIIMIKKTDGEDVEMVFGDSDKNVWVGDDHNFIEVVDSGDGKKVIIKDEDGNTKEYLLEEGKGTYFIGEDGEMKKVDNDVEWVEEGDEGIKKVTVHVDENNEAIVIMEDGKTIELKDFDAGNNTFFYSADEGSGENEVFVEVIEKKEGDKMVIMKSKIIVSSISKEDKESLKKSGVKLEDENMEKLEVENLVFHPNPSDGKFRLEFTAPEKITTEIMIYDIQGNTVYDERITNFKGKYDKEIDISSESKGTYFLNITQGKKMSSRKIILD